MTTQIEIWNAVYHARKASVHIEKVKETCQDDDELTQLQDFAHTSINDVRYFLSAITEHLRKRNKA